MLTMGLHVYIKISYNSLTVLCCSILLSPLEAKNTSCSNCLRLYLLLLVKSFNIPQFGFSFIPAAPNCAPPEPANKTKMRHSVLLLLCLSVEVFSVPLKKPEATTCGYGACTGTDPDALNVHLVAHSHDDVGWLKTVDQYYYGSNSSIQLAGVQYIIDSVVMALKANPERKFIQVESAFLWKWWREQSNKTRQDFLDLVNNGQLEIVGGAWSMNDEAAVHYHSTIDQFTFGLKFVDEIIGKCGRPKIGWQIDPFGHTREMASIFAQLGYDALFFARLDWRDKGERLSTKTAELLWRGSASLGNESLLFTHVLYNHYSPPPGFYFDVLSNDDPLIPDPNSPEYNLNAKVQDFADYVGKQSRNYSTNNILITMGNDFTYQDAHYSFKNLDILIKAFREYNLTDIRGRRINLLYSTPACYLKAVNEDATRNGISFKVKTDDFIPYASDPHTYWSGYFTSRPTQKRFERQGNNLLQVAKKLTVLSGPSVSTIDKSLFDLKSAMGIMQHHDAITGTEKQHVAQDYARLFMEAISKSHESVNEAIPKLLSKSNENLNLTFESCLLANISHCEASQEKRFVVTIHNPLSRRVSHYVRLPVNSTAFNITGPYGEEIEYQVLPSIDRFNNSPDNIKPARFELVFLAKDLPPLGIQWYYVTDDGNDEIPYDIEPTDSFVLGDENDNITVQLNPNTGFMFSASINGLSLPIRQELMYYIGAQGNNMVFENRSSGAYIFRPDPNNSVAISFTDNLLGNTKVYKGKLVDEAHQTFNEWNKQIIRVYKEENHIEFDWLVGPINITNSTGKEIISRFQTNIWGDFFTDSNGREILRRKNDFRATYNYTKEEAVAGNYYPITSGISIKDVQKAVEFAVLTDRAQGGASLDAGQIELMVHRRLLKDDAFGVGEALNETEFFGEGMVARGQHFLTFGSTTGNGQSGNTRRKQREIAQRKILSPWVFVANASAKENSLENLTEKLHPEFAGLTRSLPDDVQILTLEHWDNETILLRLEHILEAEEEGAKDITVDLQGLFTSFEVVALNETTLGANQLSTENTRLEWNVGDCLPGLDDCRSNYIPNLVDNEKDQKALKALLITLSPMQIRTFVAKVKLT